MSVRIIDATNRDLKMMIRSGSFREDLFYRINVITIHLPALRERREDIPALIEHFVDTLVRRCKHARGFSPEALRELAAYSFPGNVRELRNVVERAFLLSEHDVISVEDLPPEVRRKTTERFHGSEKGWHGLTLHQMITRTEKKVISRMLRLVNGNKVKAARMLNISRSTLYAKMEEYQIE